MRSANVTPFLFDSPRAAAQQSCEMFRPTPADAASLTRLQHLAQFQDYALGSGYDEMFDRLGTTREHYAALGDRLGAVDPQELRQRPYRSRRAARPRRCRPRLRRCAADSWHLQGRNYQHPGSVG